MKEPHTHRRWLRIVVALTAVATIGGIGLCQIQPSGRSTGVIQFDVISDGNVDLTTSGHMTLFARYWVCDDYFAVSVVWTEPPGWAFNMKTVIVWSDESSFRMGNDLFPEHVQTNTTYPKGVGERPPFRWGGGFYGGEEMRFAEAESLARRVYVDDLAPAQGRAADANGFVDMDVPNRAGGVTRKLAHLKVRATNDRIESMELFDKQRHSLARVRYEYERKADPPRVDTLVAELPVRPETLATGATRTIVSGGQTRTVSIPDANYVSHKGGRTCTVTYQDVTVGDAVVRLPVQVRVQRSDNQQLLRSARLMNFQRVDLDRAGVWEAAKAFSRLRDDYVTWQRLVDKFLEYEPPLGSLRADPNDLEVLRGLLAKYPLPERAAPPELTTERGRHPFDRPDQIPTEDEIRQRTEDMRKQREARAREAAEWRQRQRNLPQPERREIAPDDVRLIRQLDVYYVKRFSAIEGQVPQEELEFWNLSRKLRDILRYHQVPTLPEDRTPEPNQYDVRLIRQLQGRYEKLTGQDDQGLGGRLKALDALSRLDLMVKDYAAFEGHAARHLQMLADTGSNEIYLASGYRPVTDLVEARQYERADRLLHQWADKSAATNIADAIYRFCGSMAGGKADPWASVQLLDRFLTRADLTALERYEGLTLRAIALDKIDKLLATEAQEADDEARRVQAGWILSHTTRTALAGMVDPAVRTALSAWQALGPAALTEAKPYSTASMPSQTQSLLGAPDATRLQETSAQLDQIVRQRSPQPAQPGRSVQPPPTRRSGRSNRPTLPQRADGLRSTPSR